MSDQPHTADAPEIRDAGELAEERARSPLTGVPIGSNGRPMQRIMVAASDKVPTVQFGNVVLGPVMIERWLDDLGDELEGRQHRIDRGREMLKDTEFMLGIERRLLQYAIDPSSKIVSPVSGQDAFAAPPDGYDKSKVVDLSQPAGDIPAAPVPSPTPVPDAPQA